MRLDKLLHTLFNLIFPLVLNLVDSIRKRCSSQSGLYLQRVITTYGDNKLALSSNIKILSRASANFEPLYVNLYRAAYSVLGLYVKSLNA